VPRDSASGATRQTAALAICRHFSAPRNWRARAAAACMASIDQRVSKAVAASILHRIVELNRGIAWCRNAADDADGD
jgi:hypothetical protein